eukprot:1158803-Pelagomonas_calceolata.AAC.3
MEVRWSAQAAHNRGPNQSHYRGCYTAQPRRCSTVQPGRILHLLSLRDTTLCTAASPFLKNAESEATAHLKHNQAKEVDCSV